MDGCILRFFTNFTTKCQLNFASRQKNTSWCKHDDLSYKQKIGDCFLCYLQQIFTKKCELIFVLTHENNTKAKRKILYSSKHDTNDFWNNAPFKKLPYLFKVLNLKQVFWKTKTIFKKVEYRFIDAIAIIESAIFQCKVLCQKSILRQTEGRAKWTYPNQRSLATNCFVFSKILIEHKNIL